MKKTIKLPESVTAAILNQWRSKHGKLLVVEVEDESSDYEVKGSELTFDDGEQEESETKKEVKTFVAIFHQPTLDIMSEVQKRMKNDEIAASKLLFNGCKLFVPDEIMNDMSLYISTAAQLRKLTSQKKSSSKML